MFTPPSPFGYADPHIRHVHEHNALHFNKKSSPAVKAHVAEDPIKRTLDPIVTGSSILGIKYKDGVMMIGDTLASYGSMARYMDVDRVLRLGKFSLIGGTGDYSDFQNILKMLDELVVQDQVAEDGSLLSPHSIQSYLTRVMYQRRNKGDPLYNQIIIGGVRDGKSYLGLSDLRGLSYEGDIIATGYGGYIAKPLLRKFWKADLTFEEAKHLLECCMRILFYRDARASNRVTLSTVTKDGPKVSEHYELDTDWSSGNTIYQGYLIHNTGRPAETKPLNL